MRTLITIFSLILFFSLWPLSAMDSHSTTGTFAGSNNGIIATRADSLVFDEIMHQLVRSLVPSEGVGRRMVAAGTAFLGTPYVASTLEAEGDERLTVNMHGVDCTTFVEYVAAISITSMRRAYSFDAFARELTSLRYRGGVIDGYASRLHYFTNWLKDNERKGYLTLISDRVGNAPMDTLVNFMTSNPQHYRQLNDDPSYLESIAAIEKSMAGYKMRYITKDNIEEVASYIQDGDIIAFVTTIEGLDVSHTGLAIHQNDRLHLLHASTRSMEVEITDKPLSEYLEGSNNVSGILVARIG